MWSLEFRHLKSLFHGFDLLGFAFCITVINITQEFCPAIYVDMVAKRPWDCVEIAE